MDGNEIEALEREALAALETFREKLTAYRKGARKPPTFLRDHIAPVMRDDAFAECRVFSNRFRMMSELAKGKIGAEIGVQEGNFSRFMLDKLDLDTLHLFDMTKKALRQDVEDDPRTLFHKGDSSGNLATLPDAHFDWIYIDGDHRYAGARKDAIVALDKCKPGGMLFFNDYTPWSTGEAMPYGVIPVVNELVNSGLDMMAVALTRNGYFDVALRR